MSLYWPWVLLACAIGVVVVFLVVFFVTKKPEKSDLPFVYSYDDDFLIDEPAHELRRWHRLNRISAVLLACALVLSALLISRPAYVTKRNESASNRDIILCLDVSGSTLPYDREVLETYATLVDQFQGERIGLSIFNSTSRTVFPLTDDYTLVKKQLQQAANLLKGVQTQDDIDKMSQQDYQRVSDWLDGTQNRTDATSLIGDGLVGCAAMLPGVLYNTAGTENRKASIVLATDNVVSGSEQYTLNQALDIAQQAKISVDGLYSGAQQDEQGQAAQQMREAIEQHQGTYIALSGSDDIASLVTAINARQSNSSSAIQARVLDQPQWFVVALIIVVGLWLALAWRLRR